MITRNGSIIYDGTKMLKYSGERSEMLSVPDASDKTQYVAMYVQLIEDFLSRLPTEIKMQLGLTKHINPSESLKCVIAPPTKEKHCSFDYE